MDDAVYKKIEITGCSGASIEEAVQMAIQKSAETVRNMSWFEVTEIRGRIDGGAVQYQVTVKIGFKVEE